MEDIINTVISIVWYGCIITAGLYSYAGIANEIRERICYRDRFRIRFVTIGPVSLVLALLWKAFAIENVFLLVFLVPLPIAGLYLLIKFILWLIHMLFESPGADSRESDLSEAPTLSEVVGLIAQVGMVDAAKKLKMQAADLDRIRRQHGIQLTPVPYPWLRYWARLVDMVLGGSVLGVLLGIPLTILSPALLDMPQMLLFIPITFLWVFVEAFLLSVWGTTPGKWILGVVLRDATWQKITFSKALKRSFSVWLNGLGMGIPVVIAVANYVSFNRLKREGETSWDRDGGFVLMHGRFGAIRTAITILILVGFFVLAWFLN